MGNRHSLAIKGAWCSLLVPVVIFAWEVLVRREYAIWWAAANMVTLCLQLSAGIAAVHRRPVMAVLLTVVATIAFVVARVLVDIPFLTKLPIWVVLGVIIVASSTVIANRAGE